MTDNVSSFYDIIVVQGHQNGQEVWTSYHPQLAGCNASGTSIDDAAANLEKSRDAWLKVAVELGDQIPAGSASPVRTIIYATDSKASPVTLTHSGESQFQSAA